MNANSCGGFVCLDCPECMTRPGYRYTKNGYSFTVHEIRNGQVYYRRWNPGQEQMTWLENLGRVPVETWLKDIDGATIDGPAGDFS